MDPFLPFLQEAERMARAALVGIDIRQAPELERPDPGIADFALPCFPFAKALRKAPATIAAELAQRMPPSELMERVWGDRGYLNFRVNETKLVSATLDEILRSREHYGQYEDNGTRVLLEHTSVNPTGPIHVGRARNPLIGDTLARCMRKCGYRVSTEYYVNDVGRQVVLLAWGVENVPADQVTIASERAKDDHRLVAYYQRANELMERDPAVGQEVAEWTQRFEAGDEEIIAKVRATSELMLDGIRESLAAVNVHIDRYTYESEFIINGDSKRVVERLKQTPYCHEEDGAYYLDLESFGIHGRDTKFFITRKDGTMLYTTRDIAYHLHKFTRADLLINVLGEDQKLGMQRLAAALRILGGEKTPEHVFYAFVSLPEGRMSTRKGRVVYLDDLIDEAEDRALEEVRKRRTDIGEQRMREIARDIGRGAIRFNIVRVQPEKQLMFKWEEALNFEGNSAPFVQYAHARCSSILRKAGEFERVTDPGMLQDPYERSLIRVLALYPGVVRDSGERRRIHLMPMYGHDVASALNQFYTYVPVLRGGEHKDARLTLVEASRWTLRNVLDCLGLVSPEEM